MSRKFFAGRHHLRIAGTRSANQATTTTQPRAPVRRHAAAAPRADDAAERQLHSG